MYCDRDETHYSSRSGTQYFFIAWQLIEDRDNFISYCICRKKVDEFHFSLPTLKTLFYLRLTVFITGSITDVVIAFFFLNLPNHSNRSKVWGLT
jgi:hypothetical protein